MLYTTVTVQYDVSPLVASSSADDAMKVQSRSPTDLDDNFGSKFMDS